MLYSIVNYPLLLFFLDDFADQLLAENFLAGELALQQVCHELVFAVGIEDDETGGGGGGLDGGEVSIDMVLGEATQFFPSGSPAADVGWWDGSEVEMHTFDTCHRARAVQDDTAVFLYKFSFYLWRSGAR